MSAAPTSPPAGPPEGYDPACSFCRIAAGETAARVVYEDADVVAFLDARPVFPGHVLVIPRAHVPTLGELPRELIVPLMEVVKRASRAMESGLEAEGSFVAANNRVSQSVPHLHWHVVPRRRHDGLRGFFWPRTGYASEEEAAAYAEVLRRAIAAEP